MSLESPYYTLRWSLLICSSNLSLPKESAVITNCTLHYPCKVMLSINFQATARCVTVDLSSALVNYQWCDKNLKIIFFNCKTLSKLGRTRKHHFSFSLRLITLIFYELDTNAKNFFCFLNIKDICCCKEREDRIIRFVPHLLELYSVYKDILVQSSVKPLLF